MTKTKTREQAYQDYSQNHFLLKCPHCGEELVVKHSELKIKMYKPHEEEYEYWKGGFANEFKHIGKRMVTSDRTKDVYAGIKCCNCGHTFEEPVVGIFEKCCQPNGECLISFELNENETKKAKDFIKKHTHTEELKKQGKLAFTALGQEFTYTIVPGGLGNCVTIKCNICGESEDITDYENW